MQALQKLPICFFMPKWKTYSFRVLLLFAYVSDTPSTFLQLSFYCVLLFLPTVHSETVDRGFTVLVNVTIRWGFGAGATGRMQANHIHFESWLYCIIVLWRGNMQQEYNMIYSQKLLTAFRIAPEVVYGLLSAKGKVADTTGIT